MYPKFVLKSGTLFGSLIKKKKKYIYIYISTVPSTDFFVQYIKKHISKVSFHVPIKDPFSLLSVSLGPFYGGWRGYWLTTCQHVTQQTLLVNKTCIYFYSQEPGKEITNSQWGPRVSSIIECSLTLAPLANISDLG